MFSIVRTIILKFIFFVLTFTLLVCTFLSINVYADDILYTEGDFQYYIVEGGVRIAKYIGDDTEVHVPYSFGLYEIKSIEPGAFADTDVQQVYVYDNISTTKGNDNVNFTYLKATGEENTDFINTQPEEKEDNHIDPNINNDSEESEAELTQPNEENIDEVFEDVSDDISGDFEDSEEDIGFFERLFGSNDDITTEKDRKKVRNRLFELFNANDFASDFKAKPVGYFIIIFSLVSIVYLIYRYFNKR